MFKSFNNAAVIPQQQKNAKRLLREYVSTCIVIEICVIKTEIGFLKIGFF